MFRGYPLQTLSRAGLIWLAVILTSVPFGIIHLQNPNATGFLITNTALAGVWLGIAYLRTRSLWFPLGVHWAWNWALGSIFGLPVSGLETVEPSIAAILRQRSRLAHRWKLRHRRRSGLHHRAGDFDAVHLAHGPGSRQRRK